MLVIKDLEISVELDRAAMREIVGLGVRPVWPRSGRVYLMDGVPGNSGAFAAARRWSSFVRPLKIEPLRPEMMRKRRSASRR
jgi:hypothetical protein